MEDDDGIGIGIDRISELPEPILHTILSKLSEPKYLVQTSVLSKTWRWLWSSIPNLELNEQFFVPEARVSEVGFIAQEKAINIIRKRNDFFHYVANTLSHRRQTNIRTQKFRIEITFPRDMSLASRLDQWLGFATETGVQDLCLRLLASSKHLFWYNLPEVVFGCTTLSVLYLRYCRFEPKADIRLPLLRKLSLVNVYIDEHTFQKLLSCCSRIEYLAVWRCHGLENFIVSTLKLDTLNIQLPHPSKLGKIEITAPNLQDLHLEEQRAPCKIDITFCNNLKRLSLSHSNFEVTDKYVQDLFSKFPLLEDLALSHCSMVQSIGISSHRLRQVSLCLCPNLVEVKIDAPNLLRFEFWGCLKTSILLINTSNHLHLNLFLSTQEVNNRWFVEATEFLNNFNRCEGLTLDVWSETEVVIPKELREELRPSLYNVKHLKLLITKSTPNKTESLVDCLLWICPRVEKISIVSQCNPDTKFLEFVYGDIMNNSEDTCCCESHPRKCWRHFLREVKIVNFQDFEVENNLKEFFIQNVKTLEMIRVEEI